MPCLGSPPACTGAFKAHARACPALPSSEAPMEQLPPQEGTAPRRHQGLSFPFPLEPQVPSGAQLQRSSQLGSLLAPVSLLCGISKV